MAAIDAIIVVGAHPGEHFAAPAFHPADAHGPRRSRFNRRVDGAFRQLREHLDHYYVSNLEKEVNQGQGWHSTPDAGVVSCLGWNGCGWISRDRSFIWKPAIQRREKDDWYLLTERPAKHSTSGHDSEPSTALVVRGSSAWQTGCASKASSGHSQVPAARPGLRIF